MNRIRAIRRRHEADGLADEGRHRDAYVAYLEVAEYWTTCDPVLAASNWRKAALEAARTEDRSAQVEACRHALQLLPDRSNWSTGLTAETAVWALALAADGLQWLNRQDAAEAMAREAVAAAEEFDDADAAFLAYGVLGHALLRLGRPAETLACERRLLELAQAHGEPAMVAPAWADLGTALYQLHQLDEAADAENQALQTLDLMDVGAATDKIRIGPLSALSVIHRRKGNRTQSIEAAAQAMTLSARHASREQYLQARMAWALAHLIPPSEPGDIAVASAALVEVHDELIDRRASHLAGRVAINLASILLTGGEPNQAQEWAERAVSSQSGGDVDARGWGRYALAVVQVARGDMPCAQATLLDAVEDLERVRHEVDDDRLHIAVLDEQARIYRALQAVRLAAGDPDGALAASERARGRSLLRHLPSSGSPSSLVTDPTVGGIVDLAARRRVGILVYSLVPSLSVPDAAEPGSPANRNGVGGLHGWYLDGLGVTHAALDLTLLRNALSVASSTTADDVAALPEDSLAGPVRDVVVPLAREGDLPDEEAVRVLSAVFVHPLEHAIATSPADHLVVIPDGDLDRLPYTALRLESGTCLAELRPTSISPAVAVYEALSERQPAKAAPRNLLLIGDPEPVTHPLLPGLGVPALSRLKHARREVTQIAAGYQAAAPLIGATATRAAVLERMARCEVAHFATHGVYGGAEGGTPGALCLTPTDDDDGYLRADEIRTLQLPECRLAVLSACRTGWGRDSYEGSLGLARAFLVAGVASVVVSLWPVDDAATADLMIDLHQELRSGQNVAESLRRASLRSRDKGSPASVWASFTVVGNPHARIAPSPSGG